MIIISVCAFLILLSVLFPGTLHVYDLERFSGSISSGIVLPPHGFIKIAGEQKFPLYWKLELWISFCSMAVFLVYFIVRIINQKNDINSLRPYVPLVVLYLLGLFPFYNFGPGSIGYRFFLGAQIAAPLLVIPLSSFFSRWKNSVLVIGILLLLFSFVSNNAYSPELFDPPYSYYHEIGKKTVDVKNRHSLPCDLIVGHKSLAEFVTFQFGIDVLPWSPEDSFDKTAVWRLTYGVSSEMYMSFLNAEQRKNVYFVKGKYSLVREDIWEHLIREIKEKNYVLYETLNTWRNPMRVRPAYLVRGEKK